MSRRYARLTRARIASAGAIALSVAVSALVTSGGVSAAVRAHAAASGPLTIGYTTAAIVTLDPAKVAAQTNENFATLISETLTHLNNNGQVEPWLSTAWSVGRNHLTWTFRIRPGVKFSDGTPMTAADVAYSINRAIAPATGSSLASALGPIKKVTVKNKSEILITTTHPYAAMPAAMSYIPSAVVEPKAAEAAGLTNYGNDPIGTGPYMVQSFQPATGTLQLTANPHYWGPKPKIKSITATFYASEPTMVSTFQSGALDIAWLLNPPDIATLKGQSGLSVKSASGYTITYFGFNTKKAPFNNPKVRLAIAHAINIKQILQIALLNVATPVAGAVGPGVVGFDPKLKTTSYDPALAKKMLAAAGVKPGLTMSIYVPPDPIRERIASLMQQQLAAVGITTNTVVNQFATHLADVEAGDEDMFSLTWQPGTGDADSALTAFQTGAGPNFAHFSNKAIDKLITEEQEQFDPAARQTLTWKALAAVQQQAPWIPIWAAKNIVGLKSTVHGFQLVPSGNFDQMLQSASLS
jgi:peptide/nickel transport system substrate-binding protein